MRSQRRAVNADWDLIDVVAVLVAKIKTARLSKIDLVGRDGKLASDHAPRLNVDLRSVKRGFIWHFDVINSRILEHIARHFLGLLPKLRFVHKLLAELGWIVRRETHQ